MRDKVIAIILVISLVFIFPVYSFAEDINTNDEVKVENNVNNTQSENNIEENIIDSAEEKSAKEEVKVVTTPVEKVTVTLKARNGSGSYVTVQTWTAVKGGSNTWANADKNAKKYSPVTSGSTIYTYTGEWKDDFGNTYTIGERKQGSDFIALFDGKEGPTASLTVEAQYTEKTIPTLDIKYIDNIGNAGTSDSWVDNGKIAYKHTFLDPVDVPPQYTFLYWEDRENNDIKNPGETFEIKKGELQEDTSITYYAVYDYQPEIRLIYHYKDGTKDTGAKSSSIDIYGDSQAPKTIKHWFYNEEGGDPIAKGTKIALPEVISKVIEPQDITEQEDVYAHYYGVTFVDEDGKSVLKERIEYQYDTDAEDVEKPANPIKEATPQYTFLFNSWVPAITNVIEESIYQATYDSIVNTYTVIWVNYDGSQLEIDEDVPYGDMPSYDVDVPTKQSTAKYSYKFKGWSPTISEVTGDITYTAEYTSIINQYTPGTQGTFKEVCTTVKYGSNTSKAPNTNTVPVTATEAYWALLNLILALATCALAFILIIFGILNKREEDDDTNVKNRWWIRIASICVGIISLIVFFITENMNNIWVWVDKWTILMAIIFIVNIILMIIAKHKEQTTEVE